MIWILWHHTQKINLPRNSLRAPCITILCWPIFAYIHFIQHCWIDVSLAMIPHITIFIFICIYFSFYRRNNWVTKDHQFTELFPTLSFKWVTLLLEMEPEVSIFILLKNIAFWLPSRTLASNTFISHYVAIKCHMTVTLNNNNFKK